MCFVVIVKILASTTKTMWLCNMGNNYNKNRNNFFSVFFQLLIIKHKIKKIRHLTFVYFDLSLNFDILVEKWAQFRKWCKTSNSLCPFVWFYVFFWIIISFTYKQLGNLTCMNNIKCFLIACLTDKSWPISCCRQWTFGAKDVKQQQVPELSF